MGSPGPLSKFNRLLHLLGRKPRLWVYRNLILLKDTVQNYWNRLYHGPGSVSVLWLGPEWECKEDSTPKYVPRSHEEHWRDYFTKSRNPYRQSRTASVFLVLFAESSPLNFCLAGAVDVVWRTAISLPTLQTLEGELTSLLIYEIKKDVFHGPADKESPIVSSVKMAALCWK